MSAPLPNPVLAAVAKRGKEKPVARAGLVVGALFRHVSVTIMLAVGVASAAGLAGLWLIYSIEQDASLIEQNERTMQKLSESVIRGLESVMLLGNAGAVDEYAARLKTVRGLSDLRVLRTNGAEAFRDGQTILAVNQRLGANKFHVHQPVGTKPGAPPPAQYLTRVISEKSMVSYYETDLNGRRLMTMLQPMLNEAVCQGCHGGDHAVRGVLKVSTSLAGLDSAVEVSRAKTLAVVGGALIAILLLTHGLLQAIVVRRVQRVSEAMDAIVSGDFSRRVPDRDRDELGDMARAFNHMAENLLASSSMLNEKQDMMTAVLRGAHDGIIIADAKGDVVMANAAAEHLLGKSSRQIYKGGLPAIFDNPLLIQGWRGSLGDVAEEITYRQKPLQVYISRIRAPNNADLGVAVLMRDISGERQLRDEVKKLHFTDSQTGLGNARYLDHALAHFWGRAKATGSELGVLIVSIDTLKEASLAHGPKLAEQMIKRGVQALGESLGKGATLARISEDSIAAVLFGPALRQAQAFAAQALERIHESPVEGVQAWASAGIATLSPRSAEGQAVLVDAARQALAQAIEAGGGCVRSVAAGKS